MANILPFLSDDKPRDSPETQLRDAIRATGIEPPTIVFDGQLHRFATSSKPGDDSGWYVAHEDGIPGAAFGDWRTGTSVTWMADVGREISVVERMQYAQIVAESKRKAEEDRRIKNELAANDCAQIWATLTPASDDHPYLKRKGINSHMARVNGRGSLVIPMYIDGELSSLQTISPTGEKLFHSGGRVKGASATFGAQGSKVYVAEGFATAATIYQETTVWTVAAFSAHNLVEVCAQIRADYPAVKIIIVADNDKSRTGQGYANQAAAKYGATVIIPPEQGHDANDFKLAGGDLSALLNPTKEAWLISGEEFIQKPAPIKWIVKKWLQSDSLMMVHGPSGSGKTFIVLDWCLRLATGQGEWQGFKVNRCPVVYLAGEGHHGVKGRMAAWKEHNGFTGLLDQIHISKSGCDLNTPQGLQQVLSQIGELPSVPGLVVVDTLHRFLSGDENSAQDAKTMLDACAVIQQTFGCSVLLVHHTGVSEEAQHRARGSSAWRGALDIEISIQPQKGSIGILQKKSKDAELAEEIYVELCQVTIPGWIDEDREPVTSAVIITGIKPAKKEINNVPWKSFEGAWWASGTEERDSMPYVTASKWRECIETMDGRDGNRKNPRSKASAAQYVKPSNKYGHASKLIELGFIEEYEHGFRALHESCSSWIIENNSGNKR